MKLTILVAFWIVASPFLIIEYIKLQLEKSRQKAENMI